MQVRGMGMAIAMAMAVGCGGSSDHPIDSADAPSMPVESLEPVILVTWRGPDDFTKGSLIVDARFLGLVTDARVTATFRGTAIDLVRDSSRMDHFQGLVSLSSTPVEGEPIEIALTVGTEFAASTVTMPAGFTLDSVTRAADGKSLDVVWSPTSTDPMVWGAYVSGGTNHSCSASGPLDGQLTDTGMATLSMNGVGIIGIGCSFGLYLDRSRDGMTAPVFTTRGFIRATQRRTFSPPP